jgi:hypothetical protein|tara:strand:+ start:3803 stop:4348 length:546 start_codon:yes stop_codon:yes gene_type:complete
MFYALIASLPHIELDKELPITVEAFRDACGDHLSKSQWRLLNSLLDGEVSCEITHPFANRWFHAEIQLKNAVARQRAQIRGVDVKPFLRSHDHFIGLIETRVQEAFNAEDPAELESLLDHTRWELAEDFIGEDTYGFAKLAAYAVQLRIATRWNRLNDETGRINLEKTITHNTESEAAAVN